MKFGAQTGPSGRSRLGRERVLVTDGNYKHTLGIVRGLGPENDVYTCATRRLSMAGVSRWTRRGLRCPPIANGPAFVRWLDRAVRRYGFDQIIPVGYRACALLAEHRERWLPATAIVLPASESVRLALDKRATNRLAASLGLPAPRTAQPFSLDDVEPCGASVGFPLVIKAPLEGDSDVSYVEEPGKLRATYSSYLARNRWADPSLPILQQRIIGPAFGVFATYQNGRCRRIMAHRRVREDPPSGGASTCAELFSDPSLVALGRQLLDALAWHGVAMVEFKRHDADGLYYLMEVNPKLWGSLDLALAVGCDFPGDLLAIGRGEQLPEFGSPTSPLRYCWPISGDLGHLARHPAAWRAVFHDWLDGSVQKNIQLSDPVPHLVELAYAARGLLSRRDQ
jgi:predicted ATP-grasp superfamily ATP-dependent carboligase